MLDSKASPALYRAAWDFAQRKQLLASYGKDRAKLLLAELPTEHVDASIQQATETLWMAAAGCTRLFYGTGLRWSVAVGNGWYCFLSPGMSRDGSHHEPYLIAGRLDGAEVCPSCHGAGGACHLCHGSGTFHRELPVPVRQAIEAAAAARETTLEVAHV